MPPSQPFSRRRLQALFRLAAYALLLEFLINVLRASLPFPRSLDPGRLLEIIDALLSISSLPLLVVLLLFAGFCDAVRPARWEWWFARLLRPCLVLVALAYVLLIPPTIVLGSQIRSAGDAAFVADDSQRQQQLAAFRLQLQRVSDSPALRRLLEAQPQLRPSLTTPESPFADPSAALPRQRQLALRLLDRLEINLKEGALRQRADASGQLQLQQLRLAGLALVYGFFFALASLVWPRRLGPIPPSEHGFGGDAPPA